MKRSWEYNGRNSWKDFKLDILNWNDDPSEVKSATSDLPHTQGVLDFSLGTHNEIFLKERPLWWEFGRKMQNEIQKENLRYDILKWLYTTTDGIIRDSLYPSLHYRNARINRVSFPKTKNNYFRVRIDVMAYPLRRAETYEGNKLWDTFNFNTDIWQQTKYRIPHIMDQLPFKNVEVGQMVNLGGWAQIKPNAQGRLANYQTEKSYEVIAKQDLQDTDYDRKIYSGVQYQLDDGSWVRAQDVVQARTAVVDVTLWNIGTNPVIPDIIQKVYEQTTIGGITVEINGQYYNYHRISAGVFAFNDKLVLPTGKNELKLYGQGMEVDFRFRKEVP